MTTVDEFLNHKGRGSGGAYLKNWKKEGSITVAHHVKHVPTAVWFHPFPRVVVRDGKNGAPQTRHVWSGQAVCHERESTLQNQWKLDEEGRREHPPKRCPHCRMNEWFREMVLTGRLNWLRPVFRFDASDPKESQELHAGGLYNAFGEKDMDPARVQEMAAAGLYQKTAWRESNLARLNYLMVVCDVGDVQAGAQKVMVPASLGDKVKDTIRKAMLPNVLGPQRGNPFITPYAFMWTYDEKAMMDKKYDVIRAEGVQITPAIERVVRGPSVDTSSDTTPFDFKEAQAFLERHCLLARGVPWDKFFAPPEADEEEELRRAPLTPEVGRAAPAADEWSKQHAAAKGAPEADAGDDVACDACGKAIKLSDATCRHCGHKYDVTPDVAAPPPPPKPLPKRSAAASAQKQPTQGKQDDLFGDDDIPF